MTYSYQTLFPVVKTRIEQSLKEFLPVAGTFTAIFLLFRVYEFVLLRGRLNAELNVAKLEFGSLGYDVIFSSAVVAIMIVCHIAISAINPRLAYRLSTIIFSLILVVNFFAVQYFVNTLQLLNVEGLQIQLARLITISPSALHWMTVTPLLVLLPLAVAGFSEMKDYLVVHRLSSAHMLAVVLLFNLSWFFPMSPSQGRFHDDIHYSLATNKTYFLFSDALNKVKFNTEMEGKRIVSK